ncbi:MAG: alpha/beta hydrolase [Planctomycetaceae bacterium]|jgi:pimeloyl-ACP methyl ester carboxylesterase|nr:alpha/beta hydrolase [Planctomycetaceae bacterium]
MQRFILILILSAFVFRVQAGDTWFIDTRSTTTGLEHLTVKKLDNGNPSVRVWCSATLGEFLETHIPQKPLVIVIHGNWMSSGKALSYGNSFDRFLDKIEKSGEHRLLIWSWSSERILCGIRKDVLIKASRANEQADYLVSFLQRLKPDSKVSLVGFSFGARLVCNTLQMLADAKEQSNKLSIRSILLAGALDCGSLLPDGRYGRALSVTEKMLIHVNPDDEALCFYPLLVRVGGPQAVGKKGVLVNGLSEESQQKIKSVNVARQLGTEHAFLASFRTLVAYEKDFRQYALFE